MKLSLPRPATAPSAYHWHSRATWGMTLGLIIALSLLLALRPSVLGGLAETLEYDTLDFWFRLRPERVSERVAIVAVDAATVRRWNGRSFEARDVAALVRALQNSGARAIALDFPQLGELALPAADIRSLAAAMRAQGAVALPLSFEQQDGGAWPLAPVEVPERAAVRRFALDASARLAPDVARVDGRWNLRAAPDALLRAAAGAGHLNLGFDRFGRAREMPLYAGHNGLFYPALALATVRLAGIDAPGSAPKFGHNGFLLNYPYGKNTRGAAEPPFLTVSLDAALRDPRLLQATRGRVVIVGVTAPGLSSRYPTPEGARVTATQLHAVAIDNLLNGAALHRAPEVYSWLFAILPAIIVGGLASSRRPAWSGTVALICIFTVAVASLGLFMQNTWLDTVVPWLTIGLTFLVGVIGRARRQERESTHIASTVEALTNVSDIVAAQTRQWDLLDRVLHFAAQVLGAGGASALLLDEASDELTFAAAIGTHSDRLMGLRVKMGEGVAGKVAQSGEVAIVNDARDDARFSGRIDARIGFATRNLICVPLKVRDRVLGVIEVVNREDGNSFSRADAEVLKAVANQAAVALENARLYDRLAQRVEQSQGALAVANRQLQADKTLLQTVLHSMTDGVVVTDGGGYIQLVNPAAQALLPELSQDVLGQAFSRVMTDFPLQALRANGAHNGARNGQGGEAPDEAKPIMLLRGDPDAMRSIEARVAPLQSPDGEFGGLVAVFADITQRRQVEQAKSDFVSFVAHEMRSPLTSISGFSAMLQRAETAPLDAKSALPSASRARFLNLIHGESERLTRLINNLLDVARLEAGRTIEINRDDFDFVPLARLALESQRAYSSRHTLVGDFPNGLPAVSADADKVTQILINLISNALKYSPGGDVILGARAQGERLEIWVADQGPGIAPEQREILFSRFGRTPAVATGAGARSKPTGTGLGLFLTKYLVEAHGGAIWVESQAGQGATFTFTLPLASPESANGRV